MGEYIKVLRNNMDLTQEELGKLVGVNAAAVNKWEKGTVENIKRSTIVKLSETFGVTPSELMCWDNDTSTPQLDHSEQRLLDRFRELSAEGQERLIDEADMMVASGRYKKTSSESTGTEGKVKMR